MNKNTQIIAGVALVIILAIFFFRRPTSQTTLPNLAIPKTPTETQASEGNDNSTIPSQPGGFIGNTPSHAVSPPSLQPQKVQPNVPTPLPTAVVEASNAAVHQFQKNSKVQLPRGFDRMVYKMLDGHNDADTTAIMGHDTEKDLLLAVISQKGTVSMSSVKKFLMEEASDALKMDIDEKMLEHPESSDAWPGTGYTNAKVWNLKSSQNTVVVALLKRFDNRGSDLVIFKAPNKLAQKNVEVFEDVLWTIQAK
ncbi:MAG: hypothetical protein JNL11_01355 [Bdellovibrionaceae bacterium]|nr:hypothetical protein [Pseudobdellovibrionaceae bacterium]